MTLAVNNHYSFSLYTNSTLGVNYSNARLVSILDYTTALRFSNIVQMHRQIYPYLPAGTAQDYTKYTYYLFNVNGDSVVIASVWIIDSSVQQTTGANYSIRLMNVTDTQLSLIRDQLRVLGISFTID